MRESKDTLGWELLAFFTILTIVASLAYGAGFGHGATSNQDEAVKAGAAEYYLDADNQRQFRFKKP